MWVIQNVCVCVDALLVSCYIFLFTLQRIDEYDEFVRIINVHFRHVQQLFWVCYILLNNEYNIVGCSKFFTFRNTWVHPWFSVRFALLNFQFSVLYFVRHILYFFSIFSWQHCINYRSIFPIMASDYHFDIVKLFFAAKLRFPLTWSFTTKSMCRTTIRDNICVILRSRTKACTWYVIKDCHVSFDIWKW